MNEWVNLSEPEQVKLLQDSTITAEQVEALLFSRYPWVRMRALQHERISLQTLEQYSMSKGSYRLDYVAKNPSATLDILERCYKKGVRGVIIVAHPKASLHLLETVFHDVTKQWVRKPFFNPNPDFLINIVSHPNVSNELVDQVALFVSQHIPLPFDDEEQIMNVVQKYKISQHPEYKHLPFSVAKHLLEL